MVINKPPHEHQFTIVGTPGLWPPLKHHIVITASSQKELYTKVQQWKARHETNSKRD